MISGSYSARDRIKAEKIAFSLKYLAVAGLFERVAQNIYARIYLYPANPQAVSTYESRHRLDRLCTHIIPHIPEKGRPNSITYPHCKNNCKYFEITPRHGNEMGVYCICGSNYHIKAP
jgi:hypothetical protein